MHLAPFLMTRLLHVSISPPPDMLTALQTQLLQDLQGPATSLRIGASVSPPLMATEQELAPLMSNGS